MRLDVNIYFMVLSKRIELPAYAMSARRSSIELRERLVPRVGVEPTYSVLQTDVSTVITTKAIVYGVTGET